MPKLTIDIEGKFASVLDSLDRIERQSGKAVAKIQSDFKALGIGIGASLGAALSVGAIADSFAKTVEDLAALDDAAEATGASVESLSSLLNTLAPTGVGLEQITDVAGKLTKAMVGADEETSKAGAAFKALGISTKDSVGNLRGVDDVLTDVARALAQYEDGSNKTAIAQALLGKSGAQYLPLLKDLATRQRESATVTAEQAAEAERLANAWRTLGVQATNLRQKIASELIPSLADLLEQFNATGKAGGTFWERIRGAIGPNKFIAELEADMAELQQRRERLAADKRPLMQVGKVEGLAALDKQIADIQAKIERIRPAQRIANGPSLAELIDGSGLNGGGTKKDQAPALPDDGKKVKEQLSDGERLIQQLQDRLDKTRDLTVEQEILAKIGRGELKALSTVEEQRALLLAVQVDKLIAQKNAQDEATKSLKAYVDEATRAEEVIAEGFGKALVPDSAGWAKVLKILQEIRGLDPRSQETDAALRAAAEAYATGIIVSQDEFEKVGAGILGLKDPIAEVKDAGRDMLLPMQSALEDAILDFENIKSVAESFARDITRIFLRQQLTGPITEFFGALFSGKSTAGIGEGSMFGGIRSLLGFAGGGTPPVGAWSLVGEKGPELIKPLTPVSVIPNKAMGGMGGGVTVNQTNTFGSESTPGQRLRDAEAITAATIRAIREAQARGAA